MRCQTLFCGLFCGVFILLNTLMKGRGLLQSLQVHRVPLLGTGGQESGVFWHRHWELGLPFGNYRNYSCCLLFSAVHKISGHKISEKAAVKCPFSYI